ncbi:putative Myo-inositol transporter 1 [Xylogone sp. PMI_703]|nr:putative Myo-inositol transporter 1 [Xylogone sp. PMI_703]
MPLKALQKISGRPLIVLITIASSCGFLLFGYDNGVFSGLLVLPWFLATYHHPSSGLLGTISAMYNIGGFLGGTIAFIIGAKLGRRRTIFTGLCICAAGAIIQCSSTKLGQLLAGRIISGVGVGILTSTVGLWQAEVVTGRSRGMYLTLQILGGAVGGLFLAQWINYSFHNEKGSVAFTFPLAFQLVFVGISGLLITFLPESPRWLVKQNRRAEAREVLERLGGGSVDHRLAQIDEAVQLERRDGENQYLQVISCGPTQNFLRVCLACGTMIMHQLNGINSVTYYMPTLLITFVKVSHSTSLWVAGLTSVASLISALLPVFTIDRFGRRPFLWGGAALQSVFFIIIAVLLAKTQSDESNSHAYGIAAVVMLFAYFSVNSMTWLGPSWAYPAEILPLQIREKGLALGNICYWLFQFMIVEITPIAITNIHYRFYIILAAFNAVIAVIVYFCFPETKGLSLEEIDFYFVEKPGIHFQALNAAPSNVAKDEIVRQDAEHVENA